MAARRLTVTFSRAEITGDLDALKRQLAAQTSRTVVEPVELDGWLCPRRSPLVFVERSKGYVHLWFGAFGLHLAWPLHKTRPDFCSDWWR